MTDNKWLLRLVAGVIIILALWFVIDEFVKSWAELSPELNTPTWKFWLGLVIMMLLMLLWPALWIVIMRGCGAKLPVNKAYPIWWVSNIAKYIPGKLPQIAGRTWLARSWGSQAVIESFAWEFVLSISAGLILGSLLILHTVDELVYLILILAIISLFPLMNPNLVQVLLRRPIAFLGKGNWNAEVAMSRSNYLLSLTMLTFGWIGIGFAHQLLLSGIGIEIELTLLIAITSLAWSLGYLVFILPAGLGLREGAITQLMISYGAITVGALFALLSRVILIVVELFAFIVGSMMLANFEMESD